MFVPFLQKFRINDGALTNGGFDLWRSNPLRLFPKENAPTRENTSFGDELRKLFPGRTKTETETDTGATTDTNTGATIDTNIGTPTDTVGTGSEPLDELVELVGYSYDPAQDIFISTITPWQRYTGYCRLYDEFAALTGMIVDCDEIFFDYQGKKWMLGFWKGQYDMVTGGEIGFYRSVLNIPGVANGLFYRAVDDDDMLEMSYVLKKKGNVLFSRSDRHWWLTGFKLGEFSNPSELTMDVSITLKDTAMRDAFLVGMQEAGYRPEELAVDGNTVRFVFDKPRTPQPKTRNRAADWLIQRKNKSLCKEYLDMTGDWDSVQEKIKAIREGDPQIYQRISRMGKMSYGLESWLAVIIASLLLLYYLGDSLLKPATSQP